MRYEGRIFRPPSEAYSLIVQATVGCSHNGCVFCDMYKEKQFHMRPLEEVLEDLHAGRARYKRIDKIFIADGDALVLPMARWEAILGTIAQIFPECRTVTAYASPKSIGTKSDAELLWLREHGLSMAYMGLESGSDAVLTLMNKGATAADIVAAGRRIKKAGIRLSVTAISGLGGRPLWPEHAGETARAFTEMAPDYIGLLTLMLEGRAPIVEWVASGRFQLLQPEEVLEETHRMVQGIDVPGAVFRSNHPSNYLTLKGTFNDDKPALLAQIEGAMRGETELRGEHWRAL